MPARTLRASRRAIALLGIGVMLGACGAGDTQKAPAPASAADSAAAKPNNGGAAKPTAENRRKRQRRQRQKQQQQQQQQQAQPSQPQQPPAKP